MKIVVVFICMLMAACSWIKTGSTANTSLVFFSEIDKEEKKIEFSSIDKALSAVGDLRASGASVGAITLLLGAGDYREKIVIRHNNIHIKGKGVEKTRIIYGDYAGIVLADGNNIGTAGSATVTVIGEDVSFSGLTIENDFDFLYYDGLDSQSAEKVNATQAVALYLAPESDKVALFNVALLGYQDTLFADGHRAFIRDSLIAGNVDFIFGRSSLVIRDSEIRSRGRAKAVQPTGFITAPSTKMDNPFGMVLIDCRLTRETHVPDHSVGLGRPWHPTATFSDGRYADPFVNSSAVFIRAKMDKHILEEGWYWMGGTTKAGTKEPIYPEGERFYEFENSGAGALNHPTRKQLLPANADVYTEANILSGWTPLAK